MARKSEEQKERERQLALESYEIANYRTMVQQAKRLHELDRIVDYHLPNLIAQATPPALAKALREAGATRDVEAREREAVAAWCDMSNAINNNAIFYNIPHEHAEKLHDIADAIEARLAKLVEDNGGSFSDDRMTAFPHLIAASELARAKAEQLEAAVGGSQRIVIDNMNVEISVTVRTMEEQRKVAEAAEAAREERKRQHAEVSKRNAVTKAPREWKMPPAKPLDEEVRERTAARIAEITG